MSSRSKIAANESIFRRLDQYCDRYGEPIRNAGRPRWIKTDKHNREFLVYSQLLNKQVFSPTLMIARFDYGDRSYIVTAGFDSLDPLAAFQEEELRGDILTAFLAEMPVRPLRSPLEIRQVVEIGEGGAPNYEGHDFLELASLFPKTQVFSTKAFVEDQSTNIFLLFCVADRRRYDHWIDDGLGNALRKMATVSASAIPLRILCGAVLDLDPGALFLALYRGLEALYSREQCLHLMSRLGITQDWVAMSQTLEESLGWRPKEDTSLEALFKYADADDLRRVLTALAETPPATFTNLSAVTARRVYSLRNALVHYRPFHNVISLESIDWNRLCEAMIALLSDIYVALPPSAPLAVSDAA